MRINNAANYPASVLPHDAMASQSYIEWLQDNDRQGQNRQGAVFPTGRQQQWTTRPQPKDPKRSIKLGYQKALLQPTSGQRME